MQNGISFVVVSKQRLYSNSIILTLRGVIITNWVCLGYNVFSRGCFWLQSIKLYGEVVTNNEINLDWSLCKQIL